MAPHAKVAKLTPAVSEWMLAHVDTNLIPEKNYVRDMKYLRGEEQLTFNQLEELSRRVHIPVNYFLVSTPPEEDFPILQFRTIGSAPPGEPSRELLDTLSRMEYIQHWIQDQRLENDMDPLEIVGSMAIEDEAPDAVQRIRELLDIEADWAKRIRTYSATFEDLRDRIGALGITVILGTKVNKSNKRPLFIDEFRAFAMCDDQAPLIFINGNDTTGAQIFSLIHELVHICLGTSDLFDLPGEPAHEGNLRPEERFCNAVAGEFLVPSDTFEERWQKARTTRTVVEACDWLAASFYKCSMTVVARRALDKGLIALDDYRSVAAAAEQLAAREKDEKRKRNKDKQGGPNQNLLTRRSLSKRFIRMVADSVANGSTSYTEAFQLTGTSSHAFFDLVKLAGGSLQ